MFYTVCTASDLFLFTLGFTLFLQILQLLQVLKCNKKISVFAATLKASADMMSSFFIAFVCVQMTFGLLAYQLFCSGDWRYRNFLQTMYSQFSTMLGKFNIGALIEIAGTSSRLFFLSYTGVTIFLMLNMMVSILMENYADATSGKIEVGNDHLVGQFFLRKIFGQDT